MKLTRWLMLLALGSVIATACGGGSAKPSATAAPPATTVAPTTVGPILVYTDETPFAERTGHIDTFVVAYDVGGGRVTNRSTIPQTIVPILNPATGEMLYLGQFKDGAEVHGVNVVTGAERVVYRPERPLEFRVALSHDGAMLAVSEVESEADRTSPTSVKIVNLADGSARTVATFGDQFSDDFRRRPVPVVWRDDDKGFLVSGDTSSGAPGSWATVLLDGTVRVHFRDFAYPSPNGRLGALDDVGENCVSLGTQRLRIIDFDTNAEVARVDDPGRGIINKEWAPDSSALLYEQFQAVPGTESDPCRPTYEPSSGRWLLLRPGGNAPQPVADVAELRARWRLQARVDLTCVNGPADVFETCPGLDERALIVNGTEIDRGDTLRILGFIHPLK